MRIVLSFVLGVLILSGCQKPEEPPVFRKISGIKVNKVDGTTAYLTGEAIFYNPNKLKMKLKNASIDLKVDGKDVGQIDHSSKTVIPGEAEFSVPLEAELDLKEIGLLDNLLGILGGRPIEIEYKGYLRVAAHGITFKVPIDDVANVKLR